MPPQIRATISLNFSGESDPPRNTWTREACEALASAGLLDPGFYELFDGEFISRRIENPHHLQARTLLSNWLYSVFGHSFVVQKPSIDVAPEDMRTSAPIPDVMLVHCPLATLRKSLPGPNNIRLVAEISDSTLNFDLTRKAALYARSPIPEYWVLDLEQRQLIVHRDPSDGTYQNVVVYGEDEEVSPLANPEAAIRARDLILS